MNLWNGIEIIPQILLFYYMEKNKYTVKVWTAVNADGYIGLYNEEPTRNEQTRKWECKFPYCNQIVYNQFSSLVRKAGMTWQHEPEYFELTFEK